jgi:hypothetical protein
MPACIVYQAVDLAMTLDGRIDQILNVGSVAHIAINERESTGISVHFRLQAGGDRRAFQFVVTANHHLRACFDKLPSTALADAAATACDDYNLICIKEAGHANLR